MGESRLDAAHGNSIHSLHEAFDSVREALQKEKGECRVYGDRSSDGGLGKKQASGWLCGDSCRGVTTAGEERNLSERGTGITRMNDQLATPAAADDSYSSLEDQGNSFRAIAGRPENFARRESSLHGVLEQRVPASRTQVLKKLVSRVELAQVNGLFRISNRLR